MTDNRIPTIDLRNLFKFRASSVPLVVPSHFLLEYSAAELPALAPHEQLVMALLAHAIQPSHVLEFGTGQGYSSYIWAENTPDTTRIVTVDLAPPARGDYTAKILRGDSDVGRVYRDAEGAEKIEQSYIAPGGPCPEAVSLLGGKVDLAFIDGDHSYDGVRQDTEIALDVAHEGTVFLWHDFYKFPAYIAEGLAKRGVFPYLNELAAGGDLELRHISGTYLVIGRKSWDIEAAGTVLQPCNPGDGEARSRIVRLGDF